MKERSCSPDGSQYYGNGVWGPSTLDLQRANLSFNEEPKTKEEPNNDLLFVSQESIVGRLLQTISKVKLPARFAIPGSMATVVLMSACSGGGEKNTQELENKESSDYALPFPKGETWFLTGGPHADGLSNGVRYAIDIAPPEVGKCPTDGSRVVIDNRVVTASASGQVIVAGDDKNRSDPNHSMVKVKDTKGLTEVYIHLANTKVKKGDKVKQGATLGNPSCEYPPGGRNEGAHIHVGLEKDGQAIPIDGVNVEGWTIHNEPENYNGTMTKSGEKTRTAVTRRCPDDKACGGIRNDLTNEPSKQVLGESTSPTISGKVTSKEVSPSEKPVEKGWNRFTSTMLQIDYPSSWTKESSDEDTYISLTLNNRSGNAELSIDAKFLEPEYSSLDSFKKYIVGQWFGDDSEPHQAIPQVIGGQKSWKLEMEPDPEYVYVVTVTKDRGWIILLSAEEAEDWKAIQTMLASIKFLEPTETPKPTLSKEKQAQVGWTRYKSFDLPYQIDYPSNWQQAGNEFYGETTKDNPTKFEVASEPVASWITLDDYKNRFVQSVKDTIKLFGGNVQIAETPNQTINGQKAWRLDGFVTSSVTTPNRSVTYITIKDGVAWVLIYAADSSEFNQNLPTFEKMLASFKFLK